MTQESIETLQEELQKKIGRNLMRYQAIERLMKVLVANSDISTTIQNGIPVLVTRGPSIQRQTLGQVAGRVLEQVLMVGEEAPDNEQVSQIRFRTRFQLNVDAGTLQHYHEQFASMVEARNNLVHHLLEQVDVNAIEPIRTALSRLDAERAAVIPLHEWLIEVVTLMRAGMQEVAALLTSDDAQRMFDLHFLQQSRIAAVLFEAAQINARPDGWTPLATAGNVVHREAPGDLAAMKARYGHPTLKALVIATELFDVTDEPTTGGGVRPLYRVRTELLEQLSEK